MSVIVLCKTSFSRVDIVIIVFVIVNALYKGRCFLSEQKGFDLFEGQMPYL